MGTCTIRNAPTPTSHIIAATRIVIAMLVAIVLNHGCQPLRISAIGSRWCKMNIYAGPMPNITIG
jgi:hypothetical protein